MSEPEVIDAPIPQGLALIARGSGLDRTIAEHIALAFAPFVGQAGQIASQAEGVSVTDATQVTEIKKSRELRLSIREVRVAVEKERKALKEESLRRGKFIDECGNHIKGLIEPVETRLLEQEQFAERREAERMEKIRVQRAADVVLNGGKPELYALAVMTDGEFMALLMQLQREKKAAQEAAEQKALADAEQAVVAARLHAENERLRKEAEAAQAQARQERADADRLAREERMAADRRLHDERKAREKLEREAAQAKADRDRQAAAQVKLAQKAAGAPDREKFIAFADAVDALPEFSMSTEAGLALARIIDAEVAALSKSIRDRASAL